MVERFLVDARSKIDAREIVVGEGREVGGGGG
jgi:hypothetical protein